MTASHDIKKFISVFNIFRYYEKDASASESSLNHVSNQAGNMYNVTSGSVNRNGPMHFSHGDEAKGMFVFFKFYSSFFCSGGQ